MSIFLPTVDMSSAIVGTSGNISFAPAGLTNYPGGNNRATLHFYNETGFGLSISFGMSAATDYVPARGAREYLLEPGEYQLNYVVLFANPSTPVQLLLAVVYLPGEVVPDPPKSGVDLNPYNTAGLTVPIFGETSSVSSSTPIPIDMGGGANKTVYLAGWDLTSDKPAGAIVYKVHITGIATPLDYVMEATTSVTAFMPKTYPYALPASAPGQQIILTVSYLSGAANNAGVFLAAYGYELL